MIVKNIFGKKTTQNHWKPTSTFQKERRVFNFALMVRGLSKRPNLPEGPAATWGSRRSIQEEDRSQINL
jgi:hypothetical protein